MEAESITMFRTQLQFFFKNKKVLLEYIQGPMYEWKINLCIKDKFKNKVIIKCFSLIRGDLYIKIPFSFIKKKKPKDRGIRPTWLMHLPQKTVVYTILTHALTELIYTIYQIRRSMMREWDEFP